MFTYIFAFKELNSRAFSNFLAFKKHTKQTHTRNPNLEIFTRKNLQICIYILYRVIYSYIYIVRVML